MPLRKIPLLTAGLALFALLASVSLGVWLGHTGLLSQASREGDAENDSTKDALIAKLENAAAQQASPLPSLLDPAFDPFAGMFGGDPFAALDQMQARMNQLFGTMSVGASPFSLGGAMGLGGSMSGQPSIVVEDDKEEYRVVIALAEDSEITLKTDLADNTLSLSAEVRSAQQDARFGRQISSTSISHLSRDIPFREPVDATGLRTEKSSSEIVIRVPKLG